MPDLKNISRAFGYVVFSALFAYDIIGNNNPFGFENAGLFAMVILGDSAIIQLARLRYGNSETPLDSSDDVPDSSVNRVGGERGNPADPESGILARKKPRTGQGSRKHRAF